MEENNNEKVRKGSLENSEPQEEIVQQEINEQESIQEEKVEEVKEENNENVVEEKADEDKEEIKKEEPKNINIQAKAKKEVKPKKKINKQVILVAIIVIACIVITVGLIILKMRDLNKKYQYVEENDVFTTEDKVEDPDAIYATDKDTRFNYNDLVVSDYYEIDGVISQESRIPTSSIYQFVKIEGLKNKEIENKINVEIKNTVYEKAKADASGKKTCYARVDGNFSNILSIMVYTYDGNKTVYYGLNYDLNTGEKIPFENVFTKSTPIISLITESASQIKAWRIEEGAIDANITGEEYMDKVVEYYNMDNRDTSEYEDLLFKVANKYNEVKENIQYTISPTKIKVYNVLPDELATDKNGSSYYISISMYKYSEYIAIYKRYAGTDIFEKSDTALKNVRPFTIPSGYSWSTGIAQNLVYGDIADNVFADIAKSQYIWDWDEKLKKAMELGEINITNKINDLKNSLSQDKENGYVIQGSYYVSYQDNQYPDYETQKYLIPHISVVCGWHVTKFPIKEYQNLTYHLGWLAALPTASAEPPRFYDYQAQQIGGSTQMDDMTIYFDLEGNFLGTDKSVVFDEVRNLYIYDPS